MKRIVLAILALAFAAASLIGCGKEDAVIEGTWLSADGSTLTLSDGTLTLTDSMGQSILSREQLPYVHRGDFLYIDLDGVEVKVFEAALDGDSLTLTYTVEVQADMQMTADEPIQLTRSQD